MQQGIRCILGMSFAMGLGSLASGQEWVDGAERFPHNGALFANGGPGGSALLIRGTNTYERVGEEWRLLAPLPTGLNGIQAAEYDYQRGASVVLGGGMQTYELDRSGWTLHPGTPSFWAVELRYDPSVGRVMALSTNPAGTMTLDYHWTGTTWLPLPPNTRPRQVIHQLAPDFARSRLVALTPAAPGPASETWEWNGTAWSQRNPINAPPARRYAAMAYDQVGGRVMVYGGEGNPPRTDSWQWDGTNWTQVAIAAPPATSARVELTFDRVRGAMMLLDHDAGSIVDYLWTGSNWQGLRASPPKGTWYQAAVNPNTGLLVRYHNNTTWNWDGSVWTSLATPGPSPRAAEMAMDFSANNMVLFGGWEFRLVPSPGIYSLGDTWTWDGVQWLSHTPANAPSPRARHALVTHSASGGVILFGGETTANAPLTDTWLWSNGSWTDLTNTLPARPAGGISRGASGPSGTNPYVLSGGQLWQFSGQWNLVNNQVPNLTHARIGLTPAQTPIVIGLDASTYTSHELVSGSWLQRGNLTGPLDYTMHDPLRGNLIAFDRGDMRVYTGTPAAEQEIGTGCGSPAPRVFAEGTARPGNPDFRIHADDAPGGFALFALDFATTVTPLGGGCTQYLANPIVGGIAVSNAHDVASLALPLPWHPSYPGLHVYLQAVSPQAGAPLGGIAVSAAMRLTLGS